MFSIELVYESGKRFVLPFRIIEECAGEEVAGKIKIKALQETQKL